jgi:hypothetical protein
LEDAALDSAEDGRFRPRTGDDRSETSATDRRPQRQIGDLSAVGPNRCSPSFVKSPSFVGEIGISAARQRHYCNGRISLTLVGSSQPAPLARLVLLPPARPLARVTSAARQVGRQAGGRGGLTSESSEWA